MRFMGDKKQRNKKEKKQKQIVLFKQKEMESEKFSELLEVLEELEKEEKYVDVQICPHCKSPTVRRVRSMNGDMSGHIGVLPVKFECLDCGWRERLVVKATNRKQGLKDVAIIAEALDLGEV
jgi:RNase P subunit RPR2